MSFLVLKAYFKLIRFDLYLARRNFSSLYDAVRTIRSDGTRRIPMLQSRSLLP